MSFSVREAGTHNISLPTITPTVNSFWGGRHVAIATHSFLGDTADFFSNVAQAIGTFFAHRFADFMMFTTAFGYMATTATTPAYINRYTQELSAFANAVHNYVRNYQNANPGAVDLLDQEDTNLRNAFAAMSIDTRGLFYQVDARMVNRLIYSSMAHKVEFRDEIIRECHAAMNLQYNLKFINDLSHWFSDCISGTSTSAPSPSTYATSGTTATGTATGAVSPPGPVSFPIVPENVYGVIVNIPGTVAYDQHRIPPFVQQKADEIDRLRQAFDALPAASRPTAPDIFKDGISMQDFMLIPVFDASHPDVQNAMRAACAPGASAGDAAVARLNNRDLRHLYDSESLEGVYQSTNVYGLRNPAQCPACRHPGGERREVDRNHLRIDTELQDQILVFLRTHVPASP